MAIDKVNELGKAREAFDAFMANEGAGLVPFVGAEHAWTLFLAGYAAGVTRCSKQMAEVFGGGREAG